MKEKIKKFLRYPWTSKMVLESVIQHHGGRHLTNEIVVSNTVSSVITRSVTWGNTIDGHGYWQRIYARTGAQL